ncbi:hypothetical protein Cch01nite_42330 [Cellulomonas chitinilytica]|uniref:DUF4232 domain-containing protein n=1 Tax=Cellulomonas chitinilytica TaxID=398759 RepID=A0A919P932_9CELL|nr:hypothetical protein [Cellulomonas chitinilytica]GIG23509.1 hypothetical protein Cch01nite_42330 [Cellulomonas chitinilytica]
MSQARPGGRLPARVYWVRRFVVLGIPLLLVVLVVWLVAGRGSGADTPAAASDTTSTAPTASQTPTSTTGGILACTPDHLALTVAAAAESFPAGVNPAFTVTIANTGSEPCLVDAGEAQRQIVITSGEDRVWSNQDCVATGTETRSLLLSPGPDGADAQQLAWNRVRSAAGCPDGLPAPGAGTYSIAFGVAGAAAPPVVFGLG